MIGAIIGDIVGSRFEFNNHRDKNFELFTEECFVTDDSIMTLAVAKAIMETEKIVKPSIDGFGLDNDYYLLLKKMVIRYMQEIGRKYPDCGYGGMFFKWVFSDDPQPYNSFGNGAAMRISPAGFAARTENEACRLSKAVTEVTHNHEEGIKGAESVSFEDAIRNAISIGGDSDILAAITGSIAEAYYGVPEELKEIALSYLDTELRSIYDEWCEFMGNGGKIGRP